MEMSAPTARRKPGLYRRVTGSLPLLITVIVHSVAILVAAFLVVQETIIAKKKTFEAPPLTENTAQRKVERRVQIARRTAGGAQASPVSNQRIFSSAADALALPPLPDLPSSSASMFGGGFGDIGAGAGLASGAGLGTGLGAGTVGFGMSAVNFFGLQKGGERLVFIIDAGSSMVQPQRGDYPGYERVKSELAKLVGNLSPSTLFNVLVFERAVDAFDTRLIPASLDAKDRVFQWIEPYWQLENGQVAQRGTFRSNYIPDTVDLPSDGGDSRLDLALAAAFEMGADTIFVITDGTPSIQRAVTPEQEAAYERAKTDYKTERATYDTSERSLREMEAYHQKKKTWEAQRDKINADRRQRGLPPMATLSGIGGAPVAPGPRPPARPLSYYSGEEIVAYAKKKARERYASAKKSLPTINVVGYSASTKNFAFIQTLTKAFPNSVARNLGKFDAKTQF